MDKSKLVDMVIALGDENEALRAENAELRARLGLNSANSSKPPSSDGLVKPAPKSGRVKTGRKPGGQKGHKGHGLKLIREPDEIVKVSPMECKCGCSVTLEPTFHADTRYVYDARIDIKLTKFVLQGCICPNCRTKVVASPPPECRGTMNYGNVLRTLCVVLTQYGYVSIDKTHKIMRDLFGVQISPGSIKNIQREFAKKQDNARYNQGNQEEPVKISCSTS